MARTESRQFRQISGTFPVSRMNLQTVLARLREFDGAAGLDASEAERKQRLRERLENLIAEERSKARH